VDRNCGHCHTCGSRLRVVLDGEEWCDRCGAYRRYRSHGWHSETGDESQTLCRQEDEEPDYYAAFPGDPGDPFYFGDN
jgi:hypothetical protein